MPATNTIIITGGAGYIGSHTIIEFLSVEGYEIVSIDNFSNSTENTYKRIQEITGKQIKQHQLDICNLDLLRQTLKQYPNISGVIHFAAYKSVPESVAQPLLYYHNNITSLTNMLQLCQELKIPNFIFSSSCSVYGNVDHLPVTESTPFGHAESPYAHTKQIGEDIVRNFTKSQDGFQSVLLRYFNPVGGHETGLNGELPRNRPNNLVPFITQTAAGIFPKLTVFGGDYDTRDGSCIRDYIHVSDIAEAHVKAMMYLIHGKNKSKTTVFNLGTGNGVTVLEAIHSFEKVSGLKLNYEIGPRREGDVIAIYANNNLATAELNWKPKHNLDSMMLSAWKWQQHLAKEPLQC
ncbi:MAG: UDP-glucose 4-epimerase GalE [Bacteroidetes bacterium]|nr:UDP-glucose 4-epimerase GalE [Bacteroidota bacterium]